jgi:peptidoglycan/xylan/chitin deacetylase (PgdA/CDA1 family)
LRRLLALGLLSLCLVPLFSADAGARPRTVVSIEFDDATAEQWNIRDTLKTHGIGATFFINSALIGTNGYLTVNQLLALQGDGHEMAGHTRHHLNLPELSASMAMDEVCGDRQVLLSEDLAVHDFAYPDGSYNPMVEAIVQNCGYNSARTAGGITPPAMCGVGCRPAETRPPVDLYATVTVPLYVPAQGLKALKSYLLSARKKARALRGGWVQYVFHRVCDGCSDRAVKPHVLHSFFDWLVSPKIAKQVKLLRVDFLTGKPGPGR